MSADGPAAATGRQPSESARANARYVHMSWSGPWGRQARVQVGVGQGAVTLVREGCRDKGLQHHASARHAAS
eukprot:1408124-Rhodomonas_salina.2